jgi:pyruvate/2-oxoglutarate dehydrogenase complex dihydrolipoamide dehydrogenase (E3) component
VVALQPSGAVSVATPGGLLHVDAKRVVLATGARESSRAAQLVSGSRPLGVVNTGALQACLYLEHVQPNLRRPVIIGTDLVGLSAVWTCLSHGITPVAIIEPSDRPVARWPLGLFPSLVGVPMFLRSHIAAIEGGSRVERVRVQPERGPSVEIACDGVVFTGSFVPEAALASTAAIDIDKHSGGPAIDQFGRCSDPRVFAAGNLLRPVETAGWCFREGRRIGQAVADDLQGLLPPAASALRVIAGDGVKYVVPQRIFPQGPSCALRNLQIRAKQPVSGVMTVEQNGDVAWRKCISTRPHRRILIPLAGIAQCAGPGDMRVQIETGQPVGEH